MPAPEQNEYDVIIVGAGIVGPPCAIQLAKQGRRVLLLERDLREPDRIVGELLQPGGIRALKKMGLDSCLEGIDGIGCVGYEVIYNGTPVDLDYPEHAKGLSFHHGRFIQRLREAAEKQENVTMVQATVTDVVMGGAEDILGVIATKNGQKTTFLAPLTIMSDGITSNFRKTLVKTQPKVYSHMAGLVLKDAKLPSPGRGHVIIGASHAPILVYQIDPHETRILIDIQGPLPKNGDGSLRRHIEDNVVQYLPEPLQPSLLEALRDQKIRTMPGQYLPASVRYWPGLVLLGDALNMRHPLTGGGMTVAFNDAVCFTEQLESIPHFSDGMAVRTAYKKFLSKRKKYSSVINTLAIALYSLFAASSYALQVLQRGCFAYFQLGGIHVSEPMGLLAGIYQSPWMLFSHFFTVAFYGMWLDLKSHEWNFLLGIGRAIITLYTAIVVFVPLLWREMV